MLYNYTLVNISTSSNDVAGMPPSSNDEEVMMAIGTPTAVADGLAQDDTFNALFVVNTDASTFIFTGQEVHTLKRNFNRLGAHFFYLFSVKRLFL